MLNFQMLALVLQPVINFCKLCYYCQDSNPFFTKKVFRFERCELFKLKAKRLSVPGATISFPTARPVKL